MEQGRLAGARGSKQCHGFAGEKGGRGASQDVDAAIALGVTALKPLKAKHG
jgi:hypothetical protein